jgi:hypothetical protein
MLIDVKYGSKQYRGEIRRQGSSIPYSDELILGMLIFIDV